jgi:hypothetical protein
MKKILGTKKRNKTMYQMQAKNWLRVGFLLMILSIQAVSLTTAWSNKGKDDDDSYGTHVWIADHAFHAVIASINGTTEATKFEWLVTYRSAYWKGTLAPDRPFVIVSGVNPFDYFDQLNHHNYYESELRMIKDRASQRAQEEFEKAIVALKNGQWERAAFYTGAMTHYLGDLSNYMHVMGSDSPLGSEDRDQHSEYETNMRRHTDNLSDSFFNITYLPVVKLNFSDAAYEAGRRIGWLAHQNAEWMNTHYQSVLGAHQATTEFELRTEMLLDKGINEIASVIYTLGIYMESSIERIGFSFNYRSTLVIITGALIALLATMILLTRVIKQRRSSTR